MLEEIDLEYDSVTDEFNPAAPQNLSAVFTDPGPVSEAGQSVSFPGQSVSLCVAENAPKTHFQPENADLSLGEKNVGHLGHSQDPEMSDELRKMHEDHPQETERFNRHADLSDLQLRAIELSVRGHSDSEISRMIRVGRKSLWRWKTRNPTYRQYLNRSRLDRWAMIGLRQQGSVDRAACALDRLQDDQSENTRIRAAQVLVRLFGLSRPRK